MLQQILRRGTMHYAQAATSAWKKGGKDYFFFKLRVFVTRLWNHYSLNFLYAVQKKMSGKNAVIKNIHGSRMKLYFDDPGIAKELMVNGKREKPAVEFFSTFLQPGDHVLDVGANIGYYALLESLIVGENEKVYALEPVPENRKRLEENSALNGYTNITSFPFALSDITGKKKLYLSEKSNWGSLLPGENRKSKKTITVQAMTGDDFLKQAGRIDCIRMDVEGAETKVIQGLQKALSKNKVKLFIELHPHLTAKTRGRESMTRMLQQLKANGYDCVSFFRPTFRHNTNMSIDELISDPLLQDETPEQCREAKTGGHCFFLKTTTKKKEKKYA